MSFLVNDATKFLIKPSFSLSKHQPKMCYTIYYFITLVADAFVTRKEEKSNKSIFISVNNANNVLRLIFFKFLKFMNLRFYDQKSENLLKFDKTKS